MGANNDRKNKMTSKSDKSSTSKVKEKKSESMSVKDNIDRRRKKRISRKKKKEMRRKKIIASVIAVLAVITLIILIFNSIFVYNGKIANNIYIQGVNVSGMSRDDAIEELNKKFKVDNITFSYGEKKYTVKSEAVDLKYNIEDVVNEAYDYTREGSYYTDLYRYFSLNNKTLKKEISVVYNEGKMRDEIEKIAKGIDKEPVDATISIDGSIKTTKSSDGRKVNIDDTIMLLKKSIDNKKKETIPLKVEELKAEVQTSDVEKIDTVLGEYKTSFESSNEQRSYNVKKSAGVTDKILLMPGETFSYNSLTGKTNFENGYQEAPVIVNGELKPSAGGGVCQTSSTIFNAAMYAGMDIVSVTNHSSTLTYVPKGRDATVNDSGLDFKFKNDYENPVYLRNYIEGKTLRTVIYGAKSDKKNIEIKVEETDEDKNDGKISFKTYRIYKDSNGKEIKREYISGGEYKPIKK